MFGLETLIKVYGREFQFYRKLRIKYFQFGKGRSRPKNLNQIIKTPSYPPTSLSFKEPPYKAFSFSISRLRISRAF